ncbi:MAG: restriction endonuclease [Candidatus Dormibacteria bacterium]
MVRMGGATTGLQARKTHSRVLLSEQSRSWWEKSPGIGEDIEHDPLVMSIHWSWIITAGSYGLLILASLLLIFFSLHGSRILLLAGICTLALGSTGTVGLTRIALRGRTSRSAIQNVDTMSGEQFEIFLIGLFRSHGYAVRHTGRLGDFGGDLLLRKSGEVTVVQAKRYSGYVGLNAIQEVLGAKGYYHATSALVVTNSTFSRQARTLARANNVELWDRTRLLRAMGTSTLPAGVTFRESLAEGGVTVLQGAVLILLAVLTELAGPPGKWGRRSRHSRKHH